MYKRQGWRYEGLQRGLLTTFAPRIRYVTGDFSPLPGVTLLPHKTPGLPQRGLAANMYQKVGDQWLPDDFSHEQSLVFSTPKGLVIFNSCCHGGADNIVPVSYTHLDVYKRQVLRIAPVQIDRPTDKQDDGRGDGIAFPEFHRFFLTFLD